jgi:RNA polymerase sigma-70 factor (ECF subfamily)
VPPIELPATLLASALNGDRAALRRLLALLGPVIQARAIRVLTRRGGAQARDPRQELLDMTQEVFVALLENDGRVLRAWEEERGLSLENFVGLVAERQVASILRTGKRSPWTEDPTESDDLAAHAGATAQGDSLFASRELLAAVLDRLREELTPRMLHLFYALWVHETPIPTLCEELGMQADAIYAARSRIAKRARAIAEELSASPSSARISLQGAR